ncbi:YqaA family protein [Paraferrimonas sp. SM1919]|uniref:YqaA family protein n=1 Tax=Paraferrimonas sp. SM1919 TaxID=2662263 RepID=UPI0013D1CD09|nr:VTT domain-containing protein [Paraferrimonas sp. SM1919]
MAVLLSMFMAAFLAATLLPGGSEAVFVGLLKTHPQLTWGLLLMASVGNTLGGASSYLLGYLGRHQWQAKVLQSKSYKKSERLLSRYGAWSLLLSWLPLIGDILCLLAGYLKLPIQKSMVAMFIGKLCRYSLLLVIFQWIG